MHVDRIATCLKLSTQLSPLLSCVSVELLHPWPTDHNCQYYETTTNTKQTCGTFLPLLLFALKAVIAWDMLLCKAVVVTGDRLSGLVTRVSGHRFRGPGFHSRLYHIFYEVVGFSLIGTTEQLLEMKRSGLGLKNLEFGRWDPLCLPRNTPYPQMLALTPLTSGSRPV
jgi:hypothetical protein